MKINLFSQMQRRLMLMAFMLISAVTGMLAQEYITEIITIGTTKGNGGNLRREYQDKGWTVVNYDLNAGAGGWDVYIAYKTSSTANPETGYITDICVSDHDHDGDSLKFEGRTYYKAPRNKDFNGDLNRGCGSKTAYIVVFYTRDRYKLGTYGGDKRVISKLSVTNTAEDDDKWTVGMSWRNTNNTSSDYTGIADMNRDAGGHDIFIQQHFAEQTVKWKKQPTFAQDLTFNGKTQNLITMDPWKDNYGTLQYRVNGGAWSCAVPGATEVGNYKVEARIEGKTANGIVFANNSEVIPKTVTIHPPIFKANNLSAVFNQGDKRVNLSWDAPSIPGNYADFKWVVYRNGTKIAELASSAHTYSDDGYTNETNPTYDVYYVSNFWDITTRRDDTKASVLVSTTRTVPINSLMVEQEADRVVFKWASDAYPQGFGHQFLIYAGDEEDPIYKLTPSDMQTSFQWEHRTTDQHNNQQSHIDPETGVPYTEEPLNACSPRSYRIEGVIGNLVLNAIDISPKAIYEATKIKTIDASKGVYEGAVKLSWHVDQQGSLYAKTYIVERRRAEQENEEWKVQTRMSSNEDYLFYTDETALPGVYYEYRITVEDKCDDGSTVTSEKASIGFAKSTGTVTGRIAYGSTGTAVQGVDVVMNMTSSAGDHLEQFHSIYFSDVNGTVTWQYPVVEDKNSTTQNYATEKFAAGDFSIQMWVYPEAFSKSTIVDFGNGIGLGMTATGGLAFCSTTGEQQPFDGILLRQKAYNHIALTRSGKTLTCYVLTLDANSSEPNVQKANLTMGNEWSMGNAKEFSLGRFKGAVDEFRLWTKCLAEADILENFDHLLVGDESGLETYWTFDEGLRTQFFDYSRDGTNYREHHGLVGSNAQASTLTPTALRLKAKTDADGNYIIQGIPFTGEGTSYSVVPMYGIHEFNPNRSLLFVGKNALVHTANFEDVSSFTMSGYIYYAGTNVPVEGVQMYVDGIVQNKDGKVVQTSERGEYNLSVPIGHHFVEARLGGHTMVAGGRWPTQGTFYFDRPMQYDFADSTLVNFVGRVGGGLSNDTLSVGFNLSKNNIGIATIQLALNNESLSFNCQDDHISNALTERTWQSDTTSINSHTHTGIGYDAKYITIRTDSLTGEFSALLPPLKYKVRSLKIDNNPDIDFGSLPEIDLTYVSQEQTDEFTETLVDGTEQQHSYTYNTKMVKTYFADPQLELIQMLVNTDGDAPKGVFGRKAFEDFSDDFGATPIDNIWTIDDCGKPTYTYGYPIYDGGDKVKMRVWGYEVYVNRDAKDLPAVADTLALNGQVVTVSNELSNEQMVVARVDNEALGLQPGDIYDLKQDQLILDARGMNEFTFFTGLPNIAAPYTRQLSMEMERNNRTYTYDGVNAIVLGSLTTGTNFVTLGPDIVTMVLRDPPGATSKTTWTTGTTKTKLRKSAEGFFGKESMTLEGSLGYEFKQEIGVGVHVQNANFVDTRDAGNGTHFDVTEDSKTEETWSTTATQSISTGTGSAFVGAAGDVFIGASTNLIFGTARKLGLFRTAKNNPFTLDLRDAMTIGDSITTGFMYSAYELEKVMIPKWEETRRLMFTFVGSKDEAENYVNNTDHSIYVTWLNEDDPNLGVSDDTYIHIAPKNLKERTAAPDSVAWCTDQIESWRQVLADNEEDKLNAINGSSYYSRNISFDGGSPNTYSNRCDTTYQKTHNYEHRWGFTVDVGTTGQSVQGTLKLTGKLKVSTDNGWLMQTTESDEDENYKNWAQFDYSFSDGNKGTDFSVNIYESPSGWSDSFFLLGGQSYNPYEAEEKTKWFEPGRHTLSNGTEQMEMPNMRISLDGNADNSAKEVTLSDVPAGQAGQLTLHLTNLSNTNQGFDFSYNIMVQEKANQMGLEILMDGVPANGRSVFIPAGETVKKVITVRQTDPSVLDYEDLELRFCSQYQPIKIYDMVHFNVHFAPSSSPINLAISEPVLNIETLDRQEGNLEMKVSGFDRQFKGLKKLGVEYRFEGSTVWIRPDTLSFVVNSADSTSIHEHVLPATGDLRLRLYMKDDNSYPQGNYKFRAYTTTQYGTDDITVYSSEVAVVKDNVAPISLTIPTPTNGILGYGDDMAVEFNEDIVPGYVTDKNVIITARLNHQEVDHDVAKQLGGSTDQHTQNPIFLNGDFTVNFWMKWREAGSILKHGRDRFAMTVDEAGHFGVSIGQAQFVSKNVLPKNEWIFLALNFKDNDMQLSALAQHGTQTIQLFDSQEVDSVTLSTIVYSDDNNFYLGNMKGAIHDLCLYGIWRDLNDVAATKYQAKDGYVYGLMNYWPMTEGHGNVAADARHTHDFMVDGQWEINNQNFAFGLNHITDASGIVANIARINTYREESYAIELWHKAAAVAGSTADEGIFEAGAGTSGRLSLHYDAQKNIVLDYGTKSQTVASAEAAAYGDWHHLALNVVRGQSAIFYCDGKRTAVISEGDVPPLTGSSMTLGKNSAGIVDEVRIWKATIQENRLLQNMYTTLDTADVYSRGLAAYYPFEKDSVVYGEKKKVFIPDDMAPGQPRQSIQYAAASPQSSPAADIAPPLQNAVLETRLMASPVASERKVVIRLKDNTGVSPRDMEGCLLNITVDKVLDMHGNQSDPIRWTAYVQKNTLKWAKDSVTVIKRFGDEYYFDVDIVNKGGKTEYYTLYNMPEWLSLIDAIDGSPVESTGDLAPQTSKTLRFLVKPLVAVGNYSVSVGLQGNNEILEPLNIVMRVRGEAPAWTVNPDLYENMMGVVGQVYVNGVLMSNSESLVAAFIDGECRGVASIQPIRGAAFVALSVYGTAQQNVNGKMTDLDKGKPVTFRIWDASRGIAYTNANITLPSADAPVTSVLFDNSVNYGDFSSPVVFTKSNLIEQQLILKPDWNWISLGVEPVDTKTSEVFKDISTWNVYIKDRSTGTYYCNGTYWDGTLSGIHANTMYKMNLAKLSKSKELPTRLPVTGEPLRGDQAKVKLKHEWNWIGYLPTVAMTLDMALAGANPQEGDQVKSQHGFAFYGPYGWDGNLKVMESGKGYLYYSVDSIAKQFSYPATTAANAPLHIPMKSKLADETSVFFPVEPENYPDNMSMVVKLVRDGEMVTDAELGAFVGGECRGAATASASSGLYYLLIAGEGSGQPMEVRAAVDGTVVTVSTDVAFSSDAIIGTPWEPFVIELSGGAGIRTLANDEEKGQWYNIQGQPMGERKPTAPGVFIHRQANKTVKIVKKQGVK